MLKEIPQAKEQNIRNQSRQRNNFQNGKNEVNIKFVLKITLKDN